jgi:hypothetical protein
VAALAGTESDLDTPLQDIKIISLKTDTYVLSIDLNRYALHCNQAGGDRRSQIEFPIRQILNKCLQQP